MGLNNSMSYYKIVSKKIMIEANKTSCEMGEPDNSFGRLLKVAEEFKEAGATPIFLLDTERMDLFVVCEETFKKKLH